MKKDFTKKLLLLFFPFLFFFAFSLSAQTGTIGGTVLNENGEPLQGVTVMIAGTKTGTQTDKDGKFTLKAPARNSVTLSFSYLGYKVASVNTDGRKPISITLEREAASLDDVVVIGYATVKRRDLTEAVSSVGAKQIKDIPLTNAAEALTGKLAGVNILSTEGAPGAEVQIRVRGGGSITQDNSPLYIVDGIQVNDALNFVSPQDIESVDVLKDASSTSIYGARGANGVVIITTKSGKPGKTKLTYNGSVGFRKLANKMDVMSPHEFVLWQYERSRIVGDTSSFDNTYGTYYDTLVNYKNLETVDWQDRVVGRSAMYSNHNVGMSGGNQNTTFNLSLTSNREEGILLESAFDRKIASFKFDHKPSAKFKVGFNARYIDQTIKGAGTTESGSRSLNRLRNIIQYRPFELPTLPSIDEFDELYFTQSNLYNPELIVTSEYRRRFQNNLNLSGYVSYELFKNLTFRSNIGYNLTQRTDNGFNSEITSAARQYGGLPTAFIREREYYTITNSNTLQYSLNNYKKDHDLTVLLGHEIVQQESEMSYVESRYFPIGISPEKALNNMSLGTPPDPSLQQPKPVTYKSPYYRLFSLFGRINYGYKDKYLAAVSLRADRSSKFLYENGLLYFPSGSVAWRFSKEKFMDNANWLSDGKIRFGIGASGNDRIDDLLFRQLYAVSGEYSLNDVLQTAYAPTVLANPNLKWETNVTNNLGLDLAFWRNRIRVTIDAYYNKTKDLLLDLPIPPINGYTSQIQNVASTSNRGLELQIGADLARKKNFTWTSNFNIAFNKNKVESLGPITERTFNTGLLGRDGADEYILRVGEEVGLMYGFVTDGFYTVDDFNYDAATGNYTLKAGQPNTALIFGQPMPGTIKLKNLGGDSMIRVEDDRAVIGHAQPKFVGGWNNQFTFGNFDASVFVNFIVGNDIFNANKIEWTDASFQNLNMLATMNERYRYVDDQGNYITDPAQLSKLNANAKLWTPTRANRYYIHSWAVEDGSFLRINNITLGYTLPKKITDKVKISNLRIYATANNIATITGYSGYDPEIDTRRGNPLTPGTDMAGYPRSRTYVFGVNVTF